MAVAALVAVPVAGQETGKSGYDLANPTPADALRELATDRPDKTESPYTVDAGHVQIEADLVAFARDDAGMTGAETRAETVRVLPVNLKLGLTNSSDLQLLIDPFVRQTVTDRATGARARVSGFGDVTLRLKHNVWGNDGGRTAFALMPFVTFPTSSNGVGTGSVEFGLIVPLAIDVSDRVGIGLMTELDVLEQADGSGHAVSFINTAVAGYTPTERLGVYTEIYTERSTERNAEWVVTGDFGLTYAVSGNLQLDGGVNLGITDAADDVEVFVGVSRRF